jgi:hypothetical protein
MGWLLYLHLSAGEELPANLHLYTERLPSWPIVLLNCYIKLRVRMAILSMDPGIHGYPTRWAWIGRADHAHRFYGADIQLLMG